MSYEFRGGIRIVFNFTYVQLLGANQIDLKNTVLLSTVDFSK